MKGYPPTQRVSESESESEFMQKYYIPVHKVKS